MRIIALSTLKRCVNGRSGRTDNIAGNRYRLVVWINYACRVVTMRFLGTREEYDAIDVQII